MYYRRKPDTVEAVQWFSNLPTALAPNWFYCAIEGLNSPWAGKIKRIGNKLQIAMQEGTKIVNEGDWIVLSSRRELSVLDPETFERQYEPDERRAKLRSSKDEERQFAKARRNLKPLILRKESENN